MEDIRRLRPHFSVNRAAVWRGEQHCPHAPQGSKSVPSPKAPGTHQSRLKASVDDQVPTISGRWELGLKMEPLEHLFPRQLHMRQSPRMWGEHVSISVSLFRFAHLSFVFEHVLYVYSGGGCFSVAQSCLTLCDPRDCSMPGFPVFHCLPALLKFMSIESVMLSNHLILCRPLLLPLIFPRIRVFSNESALHFRWPAYWSFSV